ncbi:MAG: hypothetical protein LRY55_05205 [Leadbetterella sp.]|nr:hypothetical protein [Leadbetterella sp.]
MNWFQKIKRYFREEEAPVLTEEVPAAPAAALPETPVMAVPAEEEEDEFPHWLSSEDTLRDEGVIYGLSGTDPQEKVSIITSIYKKHTARFIRTQEELTEKIGEMNLILEKKNSGLNDLALKAGEVMKQEPREENILRVTVGLILSLGMCAGNYFLIREGLRYGFPDQNGWIAWGVFLTGMFSMYYTTSFLHNEDRVTWRRAVEELGMPLAASLFVFVQVVPHTPWYKSLGFLLFTFFAFLISGKLLLGTLARLKKEFRLLQINRNLQKEKTAAGTDWKQDMEALEKDMEKIRLEKWKIVSILNETEAHINRLNADKEAVINLFLSEYHLAKDYKDRLSGSQISKILNK